MTRLLAPLYAGPRPSDLGRGSWGSRAPYICTSRFCRRVMWVEPRIRVISRPTSDAPGESAWECPFCGRAMVEESDQDAPRVMRAANRRHLHFRRRLVAAA